MFYSLTGKLIHTASGLAVIDVGGVAFKCSVSMQTLRQIQGYQGDKQPVTLYTHLNVREDALDLYGFVSEHECSCFKLLTSISGVGPKVGLAILSELLPQQVATAAAGGDVKQFSRANGVGPKLAQRIVLELKDKVKHISVDLKTAETVANTGQESASANAEKAAQALCALGYSASEASSAVAKLDAALPVEELIRLALKSF